MEFLTVMNLDHEDIIEVEFDHDKDIYTFRGSEHESEDAFLQELFKEQFKLDY